MVKFKFVLLFLILPCQSRCRSQQWVDWPCKVFGTCERRWWNGRFLRGVMMWKKTFHVDDDLLRQFILMVMITWDSLQGSSWWSWLLRKGSVHTLGNGSVRFQPVWLWGVFSPIPHLVESNVLGDVLGKLGGVAGLSRYRHYQSDVAYVWFYSE